MGRRPRKSRPPDKHDLGRELPARARFSSGAKRLTREFCLTAAVCAFLLLAVALVFSQTLSYDFVNFDDGAYVYENPRLTHGLTAKSVAWAFTAIVCGNWHPLTLLSYLLDYQLYGLNPWGYHLTNVLLHAAAAIALFLVLRRMTGDFWPSAFVAAAFAIHPLRVESVAWVGERKDVLSGLFFMLTLGAYVGYVRHARSLVRYLLVIVLFALGLMAKPMLVTLPLVLLLLDYWPLGRMSLPSAGGKEGDRSMFSDNAFLAGNADWPKNGPVPWRLVVEKLPLLALSAASCVVTPLVQGTAVARLDITPLYSRFVNMFIAYVAYIRQFFYPAGLAVFYPHFGTKLPIWLGVVTALILALICVAVVVWRRRCPYVLVGWCWYLGMLVPVIGLVQVGAQAMADRYTYLPQIGLLIALGWAAKHFLASWAYRAWVYGVAATLVLAVLMGCARQQATYWLNGETLWNRALACTRFNAVAHYNLGNILADKGRVDEAIAQYQEALRLRPKDAEVYNNLGNLLNKNGRGDEAIANLRISLQFDPGDAFAHNNLGVALADKGRFDEAIAEYREAIKIKPNYAKALNNLGSVLDNRGRSDEAAATYEKSLKIEPDDADVYYNLGIIRYNQGRTDAAIAYFQRVLELNPNQTKARHNLAVVLLERGQLDEAIFHFSKAVEVDPKNSAARQTRDGAVAQRQEIVKAVAQDREQLRSRPDDPMLLTKIAWTLATNPIASIRNGAEAVELAGRAVQLSGGSEPVSLNILAAAYAEAGQFAKAVETAQQALALAISQNKIPQADALRVRIKLYQSGFPYRQIQQPSTPKSGQP